MRQIYVHKTNRKVPLSRWVVDPRTRDLELIHFTDVSDILNDDTWWQRLKDWFRR